MIFISQNTGLPSPRPIYHFSFRARSNNYLGNTRLPAIIFLVSAILGVFMFRQRNARNATTHSSQKTETQVHENPENDAESHKTHHTVGFTNQNLDAVIAEKDTLERDLVASGRKIRALEEKISTMAREKLVMWSDRVLQKNEIEALK
ncbi:hypothetical protein BCR34DRAFT_592009 [Clohesyomyces aquaticus]|uniref:Uncharacterized protein n=1 Tax=Clohesyomyces aquaticus TaxID=1231657 RepID=A0A1Y1YVZ1_9PLEO|nr:hypothetical protein BCR34DRAFT_592009 [Clohesyomyces aquaticus]